MKPCKQIGIHAKKNNVICNLEEVKLDMGIINVLTIFPLKIKLGLFMSICEYFTVIKLGVVRK